MNLNFRTPSRLSQLLLDEWSIQLLKVLNFVGLPAHLAPLGADLGHRVVSCIPVSTYFKKPSVWKRETARNRGAFCLNNEGITPFPPYLVYTGP